LAYFPSTCVDNSHGLALLYSEFNIAYSHQIATCPGDIFQPESYSIGEALHFFTSRYELAFANEEAFWQEGVVF